jgi:hypothetical protein
MATRSFIGKLLGDGSITGIYCHFDGYPEGVGATLKEHYMDPTKVDSLLALGSISSLGAEIGEQHEFEDRSRDWVTAYHRDRAEALEPPTVYRNIDELRRNAFDELGVEYAYVFVNGEWATTELGPA